MSGKCLDTAIQSRLGYFPWDFILVNWFFQPKLRDSNGNNTINIKKSIALIMLVFGVSSMCEGASKLVCQPPKKAYEECVTCVFASLHVISTLDVTDVITTRREEFWQSFKGNILSKSHHGYSSTPKIRLALEGVWSYHRELGITVLNIFNVTTLLTHNTEIDTHNILEKWDISF